MYMNTRAGRLTVAFVVALLIAFLGIYTVDAGPFGPTLHENEAFVEHGTHGHQNTSLGDAMLGNEAEAHASVYCGHGVKWTTVNGTLHRNAFVRHYNNRGGHVMKSRHYFWSGTSYVAGGGPYYFRWDCH